MFKRNTNKSPEEQIVTGWFPSNNINVIWLLIKMIIGIMRLRLENLTLC